MINIWKNLDPKVKEVILQDPSHVVIFLIIVVLTVVIGFLFYVLCIWLSMKVSGKVFRFLEKRHGKKIHLQFAENLVKGFIIILFVVIPLAGDRIKQSILGSAAVLAAIVGFAAQDVIKDILSGLLISIYKPFDLGDRIELEDGTAGIVESISMRHVVLVLIDTVRLIIPNSKLNGATVKNFSYSYVFRSAEFTFPVNYKSEIAKAKEIIFNAVEESPYSVPGKRNKNGENVYGPVYFISIADSALLMKVTVYYEDGTPTEVLKDDINTRVFEALIKHGIDVPYNYSNVVLKLDGKTDIGSL